MGRILDSLSRQPTPWLQKIQLDAQPSQPLLQRVFSKLPKRRAGERYAYGIAPHAFMARQPEHPPLGNVTLWQQPLISNICWNDKPPLAALAAPSGSLLGGMSSHRVPGAVASLLVLGLCLAYLINHQPLSPEQSAPHPEQVAATDAPLADNEDKALATPMADADDTTGAVPDEAPTVAEVLDAGDDSGEKTVGKDSLDATDQEQAQAEAPASQPVSAEDTTSDPAANDESMSADSEDEEAPAELADATDVAATDDDAVESIDTSEEQAARTAATAEDSMPAPAADAGASAATAEASSEQPAATVKVKTETSQADDNAQATSAKSETTPAQPVYFNMQRSLAILTEARYLYLSGEGPLAAERLGLALESGHIHPDHVSAFARMETDIRALLAGFETAQTTGDAQAIEQFLALEEEIFPGKVSAYETQLPAPAGDNAAEENTDSEQPMGLQPAAPEEGGEDRPH